MLSPNHRSYYLYFENQHRILRRRNFIKTLRKYIAVRKLLNNVSTDREYHFLFNQIKVFLGVGLNPPHENKLDSYLKFLEFSRPNIFDNFLVDLRPALPIEEDLHPWKLGMNPSANKGEINVQNTLGRSVVPLPILPLLRSILKMIDPGTGWLG